MFSIRLFVLMILALPLPASAQSTIVGQIVAGDWTGTANAVNGKFANCIINGPKTSPSANQLSFVGHADGIISIWLENLQLPAPKCRDGGFLGSGDCSVTGVRSPALASDAGPVDVRLGVGDYIAKDMKSYKGRRTLLSNSVAVDLPPGDDLLDRLKTARRLSGAVVQLDASFSADLGPSLMPFRNSAAYTAVEELKKCVASHK